MKCDAARAQLTAYLDGELDAERGTVVRGHLRTCASCRAAATDEAALRDGLRALAPIDPPPMLWAAVQARLAEEEVRYAERPRWRRTLTRWAGALPSLPRLAAGATVAATLVAVVWWRAGRDQAEPQHTATLADQPSPIIAPSPAPVPAPVPENDRCADLARDDVSASLAREPACVAASYQRTIDELMAVGADMRPSWSEATRKQFDDRVAVLRSEIAQAQAGKPQQRASRALIRYLEAALIRDVVAVVP